MALQMVQTRVLSPDRFESVIEAAPYRAFVDGIARAQRLLADRVVWNVNSTARGGGVAEMLHSLIAYARGAGVDARWAVIGGSPDFFRVTKRLHNNLHGYPGDGGPLGAAERDEYAAALEANAEELAEMVRPRDIVILHDPQTAGLIHGLRNRAASVIWRCHVGVDRPNDLARAAWDFLRPFVEPADAYVFSRAAYAWEGLDPNRCVVVAPSIDAFSPKNQDLGPQTVDAIILAGGLSGGTRDDGDATAADPTFRRQDDSTGTVRRRTVFVEGQPPPPPEAPLVVQVSRWDRLKDPLGVMRGFAEVVAPAGDSHLIVAGPDVEAVADDPEGTEVLAECLEAWRRFPGAVKPFIHLACLPMEDPDENAAIVNALQRRADVVVQKSLAEGFGLTVTEAMWKSRPVVASGIGGIQEQIIDGHSGVLIPDPTDLGAFGQAVRSLLEDPARAEAVGAAARARARDLFLGPRHLLQYLDLFIRLLED
jgi:trehalose synthase